jgi:hypothetical protein
VLLKQQDFRIERLQPTSAPNATREKTTCARLAGTSLLAEAGQTTFKPHSEAVRDVIVGTEFRLISAGEQPVEFSGIRIRTVCSTLWLGQRP